MSEMAKRLREVLAAGKGTVLLVPHDFPDPDCLAATLGLQALLDHWRIPAEIVHAGGMGRAENKAMAGLLGIDHKAFAEIDLTSCRGAILADTQPGVGNNSLPESVPLLAVLDHHPLAEEQAAAVPFVDVRTDFGSTSAMVLEYLDSEDVSIDANLATALFLGIRTDTDNLLRDASRQDVEGYVRLLPVVDLELVNKIVRPPLPDEYFSLLNTALKEARRHGEALVANLGYVEQPDFLSAVSDLLIQSKNAAWALAAGWSSERVCLSLRIRPPRKNAANIIRKTVGEIGTGGGHALAAGGQIPFGDDTPEDACKQAVARFLQAVGMGGEPSRFLCASPAAPDNHSAAGE